MAMNKLSNCTLQPGSSAMFPWPQSRHLLLRFSSIDLLLLSVDPTKNNARGVISQVLPGIAANYESNAVPMYRIVRESVDFRYDLAETDPIPYQPSSRVLHTCRRVGTPPLFMYALLHRDSIWYFRPSQPWDKVFAYPRVMG